MKLSHKLLILIVVTSLLPLLVSGIIAAITTQKAFEGQVRSQIEATASRQSKSLNAILEQNAAQLSIIANRLQLRLLIDQYNREGGVGTREAITANLTRTLKTETSFQNILIVNPRGIVISSTDMARIGSSYADNPAFLSGKEGQVSDIVATKNGAEVQVLASPLFLRDKMIGVVVTEVPIELYSVITREYTDLGATGESFIVKEEAKGTRIYVTPLRFENRMNLNQPVHQPEPNWDYREHEVLKVRKELFNGWVLVTKIDTAEINAPVSKLRSVVIISTCLTLLAAVILGLLASRKITQPIERFTRTVTKIREGDYGRRVEVRSNDEIGILGAAFNQMTDSMQASQKRLESSIAALSQGFIIIDNDRKVKHVNDSTRQLLQIDANKIIEGKSVGTVLSEVADLNLNAALERCFNGQYVDVPDLQLSGRSLRFFFSPVSLSDRIDGAVILIVDETEERILQRSRDEFFSIASHELRTPLTAIRGNASLMQQFYPEVTKDPSLKEVVADIYDSSTRLISIVNDFLDVSRLEQDKITFDIAPLDINTVTRDVVKEMTTVAAEKKTKLKIDAKLESSPPVLGDHDRVKQVIYNLIGNALKFTPGGVITVSGRVEGKYLKIQVTDTGAGMNEESQKLLFHKFQQATDNIFTRDSSRGTGLGLYISKILIEKMDGAIHLDSSVPGKGSTFSFTLPLANETKKLV